MQLQREIGLDSAIAAEVGMPRAGARNERMEFPSKKLL